MNIALLLTSAILIFTAAYADDNTEAHQATCSSSSSNGDGSDNTCTTNERPDRIPHHQVNIPQNGPIAVTFQNNSPHRVDIYFDDGRFGTIFGTAESDGGEVKINTFPHLQFFVTLHGEWQDFFALI